MADLTTRERVEQAVGRGFDLLAQLTAAKGQVLLMKRDEDGVRLSNPVDAIEAEALKEKEAAIKSADAICKEAVATAENPFEAARATRDQIVREAQAIFNKLKEESEAAYQRAVANARKEQAMKMAEVHAGVYRAEKEVAAIEATIEQNRRQVKESLGIDLAQLTMATP